MKIIHNFLLCQLVIVLTTIHATLANLPEPSILEFNLSKVSNLPKSEKDFPQKITMTAAIVMILSLKYVSSLPGGLCHSDTNNATAKDKT